RGCVRGLFRNPAHLVIEPVGTEEYQARQSEEQEHANLARHLFWRVRGFVGGGTHVSSAFPVSAGPGRIRLHGMGGSGQGGGCPSRSREGARESRSLPAC